MSEAARDRQQAIAYLFQVHYADLVGLGFFLTSDWDLAEELVQEAFMRTWRRWGHLRNTTSAPAYLRSTVVNLARSSLRRRLVEARHLMGLMREDPETDPAGNVDLLRAAARLPRRKRECLVLRYYAGLTVEETAAALSVSVGTVKSQTHKALQLLEHQLRDDSGPNWAADTRAGSTEGKEVP